MKKFPECFPENFEKEILPKAAKEENKSVYRVIKYGTINRDSFISTYEEIQRGLIPPKRKMNSNDPGLYSTSCNIEYTEAGICFKFVYETSSKSIHCKGTNRENMWLMSAYFRKRKKK